MLSPWCLGGCLREGSAKIPWEMVPGRRVPVLWSVPRSGGSLEGEKEQSGEEQRCCTHSQATLTEDSEEALGMQEGYLGHSSGHTGTLAPRHKNCMYSRGRLHRGRKDAAYHKRQQHQVILRQSDHPIPPFLQFPPVLYLSTLSWKGSGSPGGLSLLCHLQPPTAGE